VNVDAWEWKTNEVADWVVYGDLPAKVAIELNCSFQNFFRRVKNGETPGFPRFKGRNRFRSLVFTPTAFRVEGDHVKISKVGSLKIRLHRALPETKGDVVSQTGMRYVVCVLLMRNPATPVAQAR
jgi:putative transposase